MEIEPIAHFHSPFSSKFGIPKQSGLVESLRGEIVFVPKYRNRDALRGLDEFDYIWLIWGFSLNRPRHADAPERTDGSPETFEATVRPPRLGGNTRVGVFASRSPFRPNGLGLSAVRITKVDFGKCTIEVRGADLADGTPVYDIKPYVEYADSHAGARSGFVDSSEWKTLKVIFPEHIRQEFDGERLAALEEILSQDPRPQFQHDPDRVYGMNYAGAEIKFRVSGDILEVL